MTAHTNEWAVILGASAGTGAASAAALSRRHRLNVFGVHRGNHLDTAEQVQRAVQASGATCHLRMAEAGTHSAAREGARELLSVAGPRSVRIFVHAIANASVARLVTGEGPPPAHPKQVQKTFEAMAHSFLWWAQALYELDLLAPGARLLALSNPMTDQILRGTALVAAAKAALEIYVRHMAAELGPSGFRVNILKFGAVNTNALRATVGAEGADRIERAVRAVVPAGRLLRIEEVGELIALLAGEEMAWFNGATIDFTGGETQSLWDHIVNNPTGSKP